jgi:hypothetical protein
MLLFTTAKHHRGKPPTMQLRRQTRRQATQHKRAYRSTCRWQPNASRQRRVQPYRRRRRPPPLVCCAPPRPRLPLPATLARSRSCLLLQPSAPLLLPSLLLLLLLLFSRVVTMVVVERVEPLAFEFHDVVHRLPISVRQCLVHYVLEPVFFKYKPKTVLKQKQKQHKIQTPLTNAKAYC